MHPHFVKTCNALFYRIYMDALSRDTMHHNRIMTRLTPCHGTQLKRSPRARSTVILTAEAPPSSWAAKLSPAGWRHGMGGRSLQLQQTRDLPKMHTLRLCTEA